MAKVDKQVLIQAAADLADKEGLFNVTLKGLSQIMGIRSPSLYNHIQGLDDLKSLLMLHGWAQLGNEIVVAAVGKSGNDAVRAMCYAYRNYAMKHPGVFAAMLWFNQQSSQEAAQTGSEMTKFISLVLSAYNLKDVEKIHASRMFRSFLQGFCSIDNNNGFVDPVPLQESFDFAVEVLIKGLEELRNGYI